MPTFTVTRRASTITRPETIRGVTVCASWATTTLVALESYTIGGARVWAGVWRGGSDAHYLWMNANWNNFVAKWQQLAQQNLRLTVLTTYEEGGTRLYAGVWRAGSDPYYLWGNASQANFLAKWQELNGQNLPLGDMETDTNAPPR